MRAVLSTFGSTGDVQPLVALAAELRRAGHHPVIALSPNFESRARGLGVEFVPVGPPLPSEVIRGVMSTLMQTASPIEQVRHFLESSLVALPQIYRDLLEACRGADVLIGSPFQFACRMVRDVTGIPYVSLHLSQFGDLGTQETRKVSAALVNPYRLREGLRPVDDPLGEDGTSDELALYAVSAHLLNRPANWPSYKQVTGFFFLDEEKWQPDPKLADFCSHEEKPVVVTFGSMTHSDPAALTALLFQAARQLGRRVLIQHGWSGLAAGEVPENVHAAGFAPHSWLFPRAALVVHHGGAGTTASAFRAGVPTVVVPHTLDQPIWAEFARAKGCTRNVIPLGLLTPARLTAAIAGTLRSPEIARAASSFAAQIREEHGITAACRLIEGLMADRRRPASARKQMVLKRLPRDGDLPLSYGQQRLWFLDQLLGKSPLYNMAFGLRIAGELDRSTLKRSIQDLVDRHEILRTAFPSRNGVPMQRIAPALEIAVAELDLSPLPAKERQDRASEYASEWARIPFDLESGPLFRAELICLGEAGYLLLLNMHHIVSDGWSMTVAVRDLSTFYEARRSGRPPELPPLNYQYADVAVSQREWLEGESAEAHIRYWRDRLANVPALDLSMSVRPQPGAAHRGATVSTDIESGLVLKLKNLGRQQGCTVFMILLAVFNAMLRKYTGQEDIAVGTVIANRNERELQDLIGYFANTLVMRTDLSNDPTFEELLKRVRQTAVEAYIHQDIPFEKVVEVASPVQGRGHAPLFQVLFVLQGALAPEIGASTGWLEPFEIETGTAKFDLSLYVTEVPAGLRMSFEYDTALFDEAGMLRLIGHLRTLLERVIDSPRQALSAISMLSDTERGTVLHGWNSPYSAPVVRGFLPDLIAQQADRTPDSTAVSVLSGGELTYAALNRRANQIANYLGKVGAGPEVRVGVFMDRGIELVPALLGILKAGATYVPLDPKYPPERLSYMLRDCDAPIVLSNRAFPNGMGDYSGRLIDLRDCSDEIHRESDENPGRTISHENAAYLIYTSGSTGRPKGVAIRHGSVAVFLQWALGAFSRSELDRVLASTSVCFDLSVFEMFAPLCCGGAAWMAGDVLDLAQTAAAVSLINTVPSAMRELVRLKAIPPSVLAVNLAGEALTPDLVAAVFASCPVTRVLNLYGPSEDTTYSTFASFDRNGGRLPAVPIGKPIAGTQAYVLDARLDPVPVGLAGELYLGGAGLARGYLNAPEMTAQRFIPNPFSGAGERMYKTGDLVRWLDDGSLTFLGRIDHQVKIRGFRIEPGEIEQALKRQEFVANAVVIARDDVSGHKRLVAYTVPKHGHNPDAFSLKANLRAWLPEYMIPTDFVIIPALPLTPNGKLDRKALPPPADSQQDTAAPYIPPRTEVETILCGIWEEVLGVRQIGVDTGFFDIGGHSLLATQIASRAADAFQVHIAVRQLFESPTVAQLAAAIEKLRASSVNPERKQNPITRRPRPPALSADAAAKGRA